MTKKIVIASVLKPVDDVRAYWKIAQSLAKTNKYEVNIIGNAGKKEADSSKIVFHPFSVDRNQLIRRYMFRYKVLKVAFQVRPELLIITTHELIGVALILKLVLRTKVIYDVQENHRLNLMINNHLGKRIYAKMMSFKEDLLTKWIDHFWFAEKCYTWELSFGKKSKTVLQNKALHLDITPSQNSNIRMLFSGTISHYSGALDAIKLMKGISSEKPDAKGIMIGQIHDTELHKSLKKATKEDPSIQLVLSSNPIPYEAIIEKLKWANLGIIAYQPNQINQHRIPTKLYEYSRYGLDYIVQQNTLWSRVGKRLGGAIPINMAEPAFDQIIPEICQMREAKPYPHQDTWEFESSKLITSIDDLLNKS